MAKLISSTRKKKTHPIQSRAVQQAGRIASQGAHVKDGQLKSIPLNEISTDPEQPRKLHQLGITPQSVKDHILGDINLADESYAGKAAADAFQTLIGLSENIKEHDLIQPISVYGFGDGYLIEEGERRFLAHILIGKTEIRSIVRPKSSKISKTFARQISENLARTDLTLTERVSGLMKLNAHLSEEGSNPLSGDDVSRLFNVKTTMAYKYLRVLEAEDFILEAIFDNQIKTISSAFDIVAIKTREEQRLAIEKLKDSVDIEIIPTPVKKTRAGRPATTVNLGATKDTELVKRIIKKCISKSLFEEKFSEVDWSSIEATKNAWTKAIEILTQKG